LISEKMLSRRFDRRGVGGFAGCRTITKVNIIGDTQTLDVKLEKDWRCKESP